MLGLVAKQLKNRFSFYDLTKAVTFSIFGFIPCFLEENRKLFFIILCDFLLEKIFGSKKL